MVPMKSIILTTQIFFLSTRHFCIVHENFEKL